MDSNLNNILQVDPHETREANVVEQAAEIIQAEVVESAPSALIPSVPVALPAPVVHDPQNDDLNDDVEFAREQIKNLIDDGRSAMNGALELATAGDQPRAYEVVAQLLQAVVEANKELILLHKARKETQKLDREAKNVGAGEAAPGQINIDKAVFVGRASDLLRELQTAKKLAAAALAAKSDDSASKS